MPKISDLPTAGAINPNDLFIVVDTYNFLPVTKKVTAATLVSISPVQSVAGKTGAVVISTSDIDGLAAVAASGSASDIISGTLSHERLPAATTTAPGAVVVGAGLTVINGNVAASVQSVAGKTGEVTLSLSDIGGTSSIVFSRATDTPNSTAVTNIVALSQAAYDAISTPDPNTLYVIS